MSERHSEEFGALLRQALAHHQAGRLAEAETLYRKILQNNPCHSEALRLLGALARQRGESDAALNFLERALRSNPNSAWACFDLARLEIDRKEIDAAVPLLERAVQLQPVFPEAHHALGNAYAACWFLDKAIASYRQALAQNPGLAGMGDAIAFVERQAREVSALADQIQRAIHEPVNRTFASRLAGCALETRELFPHLLNQLGLIGTGVEVGVRKGQFSEHLLQHWQGRLLFSVDPWREFSQREYQDSANVSQANQDQLCCDTIKRLMRYAGRSVIWRMTSREAAPLVPDGSLDFCYVDADHSYEAVREDIQLWHPKVKPGGILGGHDYIADGSYSFGTFGVQSAVNEFANAHNLEPIITKEAPFRSWFVVKV
ncbi:MAG: tetratricopeptide repeat protein [Verrucomicrobia bacterium]|nr:tetratricopeptide repeat protein [Verrucomicrobiota bacterium]